ncbi:MAG TPA: ribonuclease III [Balneolaceae bacterium]|nr:ribonuclease III [Balneolaceae bacterium]
MMFENLRAYLEDQPNPGPEYRDKIEALEEIIDASIDNPFLFIRALRHRSSLNDGKHDQTDSYERLEFLGDAVLDLIVSEIIFDLFPQEDEGFLTKLRAKLVNRDALAKYAKKLGLGPLIIVGDRSQGQGIEYSKSALSDVFESLIGAIYINKGYDKAAGFASTIIEQCMDVKELTTTLENYKSMLLEYAQAQKMTIPRYEVVEEMGPGHDKTFRIRAIVDEKERGQGVGKSKKEAEQKAARQALIHLKKS